ncbi:MAG: 1-deoxy-D-xylulose-5-phosphate synthase [Candidatus Eisenbacteria sp.]|nr:1-deoxy-D-xylulose-5-phosphate synthase [Candidatus Eisenbacteria bacterium]
MRAISDSRDLKGLSIGQLELLCEEIRGLIMETVRRTGGHLAPSLGVVELTVALHRAFDSPQDKIIWDVGHQCYAHKILTGRREAFARLRQVGGPSGFCRRSESEHDPFGAGHASTSISAALGIAAARDALGRDFSVIAVIGDGGLSGGLAFEGLDNAGVSGRDFIVILNDNKMSISPTVGALSRHLTEIITHPLFERTKKEVWDLTEKLPRLTRPVQQIVRRIEESLKGLITPGLFFEDLGFRYLGPIDGHKLNELIPVLQKVRRMKGPILVHVLTQKGRGSAAAEDNPRKFHGIAPIPTEREKVEKRPARISYTEIFGETLVELAVHRKELVAITAAMCDGTGLTEFARHFPQRFYDVGIAEGHAVTFAGGLATQGIRPVVAIYSTFLQRAYDHLIHDIGLQNLPVIFALDRAGLVGEDGATHHGAFDISYMTSIPNFTVAAPRDGKELRDLLYTAAASNAGPFAIRYPRLAVPDAGALEHEPELLEIGTWEHLRQGQDGCFLAVGTMVEVALAAADRLALRGLRMGVVNARFLKPLDGELLARLAEEHDLLVTIEENSLTGGFGSLVASVLATQGWEGSAAPRLLSLGLPDAFVEHGTRQQLLEIVGLTPERICAQVALVLQRQRDECKLGSRPLEMPSA